jgi:hypothetical protein
MAVGLGISIDCWLGLGLGGMITHPADLYPYPEILRLTSLIWQKREGRRLFT